MLALLSILVFFFCLSELSVTQIKLNSYVCPELSEKMEQMKEKIT